MHTLLPPPPPPSTHTGPFIPPSHAPIPRLLFSRSSEAPPKCSHQLLTSMAYKLSQRSINVGVFVFFFCAAACNSMVNERRTRQVPDARAELTPRGRCGSGEATALYVCIVFTVNLGKHLAEGHCDTPPGFGVNRSVMRSDVCTPCLCARLRRSVNPRSEVNKSQVWIDIHGQTLLMSLTPGGVAECTYLACKMRDRRKVIIAVDAP